MGTALTTSYLLIADSLRRCVDMINMRWSHKGQMISRMQLLEAVRDHIADEVILRMRIVEIEQLPASPRLARRSGCLRPGLRGRSR
jgi:hypothetical protein